jgi:predicted metal-binding protein
MMEAGRIHKDISFEIHDIIKKTSCTSLMLGAGGCDICSPCSYPGEPCRFPEKTTASMEACGINVVDLCPKVGFKYINGADTVTYFSLIFFD